MKCFYRQMRNCLWTRDVKLIIQMSIKYKLEENALVDVERQFCDGGKVPLVAYFQM